MGSWHGSCFTEMLTANAVIAVNRWLLSCDNQWGFSLLQGHAHLECAEWLPEWLLACFQFSKRCWQLMPSLQSAVVSLDMIMSWDVGNACGEWTEWLPGSELKCAPFQGGAGRRCYQRLLGNDSELGYKCMCPVSRRCLWRMVLVQSFGDFQSGR